MCNGCCIKSLRWENGVLQYLVGGEWKDVPGSPIVPGAGIPNIPPDNPDLPVTQSLSCSKAVGAWKVVEAAAAALIAVGNADLITFYTSVQSEYAHIDWDNFELFKFSVGDAQSIDWTEMDTLWNDNKADIEATFICYLQDAFDKTQSLSSGELTAIKSYDFDSPSADLDDFLTEVLSMVENAAYQEQASYHAQSELGECNCDGAMPPPEIPEGFGRIETYLTRGLSYAQHDPTPDTASGFTPEEMIAFEASEGGDGIMLSQNSWRSELGYNGVNHGIGLIWKAPEGTRITKLLFDLTWAGSGAGITINVGIFKANAAGDWSLLFHNASASPADYPVNDAAFPLVGLAVSTYQRCISTSLAC